MVLIEMMIAIALLAVFASVAAPLTRKAIVLMSDANQRHNQIVTTEAMLRQLRRDVWGAQQVTAVDRGVELRQASQVIAWTTDGSEIRRAARRSAAGADEKVEPAEETISRWQTPGLQIALSPAADGVGVVGRDGQQQGVELFQLQSQLAMLRRSK